MEKATEILQKTLSGWHDEPGELTSSQLQAAVDDKGDDAENGYLHLAVGENGGYLHLDGVGKTAVTREGQADRVGSDPATSDYLHLEGVDGVAEHVDSDDDGGDNDDDGPDTDDGKNDDGDDGAALTLVAQVPPDAKQPVLDNPTSLPSEQEHNQVDQPLPQIEQTKSVDMLTQVSAGTAGYMTTINQVDSTTHPLSVFAAEHFSDHPSNDPSDMSPSKDSPRKKSLYGTLRRTIKKKSSASSLKVHMLVYTEALEIPSSMIRVKEPGMSDMAVSTWGDINDFLRQRQGMVGEREVRWLQSLVATTLQHDWLRDETYCQLMRQMTQNPHPSQVQRAWWMLFSFAISFSPSERLFPYLLSFITTNAAMAQSVKIKAFASLALIALLKQKQNGSRTGPPSQTEIVSAKQFNPLIACRVRLIDGETKTIGLEPAATVADIMLSLCTHISLSNPHEWSLYDPRAKKVVQHAEYYGDIVSRWERDTSNDNNDDDADVDDDDDGKSYLELRKSVGTEATATTTPLTTPPPTSPCKEPHSNTGATPHSTPPSTPHSSTSPPTSVADRAAKREQCFDEINRARVALERGELLLPPKIESTSAATGGTLKRSFSFTRKKSKSSVILTPGAITFAASFWTHSTEMLEQPLTHGHDQETLVMAMRVYTSLLALADIEGGMFEAAVQGIILNCLKYESVCNEVYLQLIKQLTENPDSDLKTRLQVWRVMVLITGVVAPRQRPLISLINAHLRLNRLDSNTDVALYAAQATVALARIKENSNRKYPPSVAEIQSVVSRQPLTTKIYFVNGRSDVHEFDPATNVRELLTVLESRHSISASTFAVFEVFGKLERNMLAHERIADALYKWERYILTTGSAGSLEFTVKKRLFINPKEMPANDFELNLIVSQAISDVQADRYPVDTEEAEKVVAYYAQLKASEGDGVGVEGEDYKVHINACLPDHMRGAVVRERVARHHHQLRECTREQCLHQCLELFMQWEFYGATIFDVRNRDMVSLPSALWLGVNAVGIHFFEQRTKTKTPLMSVRYQSIAQYFPSLHTISISVVKSSKQVIKIDLVTNHATQIAHLIKDYTLVIVNRGFVEPPQPQRTQNMSPARHDDIKEEEEPDLEEAQNPLFKNQLEVLVKKQQESLGKNQQKPFVEKGNHAVVEKEEENDPYEQFAVVKSLSNAEDGFGEEEDA
eukprot:m.10551 g.10551  ORF g.10551 m.10551 type:complete len:1185 (-) comp8387_c0_seq1:24-3578(-)